MDAVYKITLLVTLEQEHAIMDVFTKKKWKYVRHNEKKSKCCSIEDTNRHAAPNITQGGMVVDKGGTTEKQLAYHSNTTTSHTKDIQSESSVANKTENKSKNINTEKQISSNSSIYNTTNHTKDIHSESSVANKTENKSKNINKEKQLASNSSIYNTTNHTKDIQSESPEASKTENKNINKDLDTSYITVKVEKETVLDYPGYPTTSGPPDTSVAKTNDTTDDKTGRFTNIQPKTTVSDSKGINLLKPNQFIGCFVKILPVKTKNIQKELKKSKPKAEPTVAMLIELEKSKRKQVGNLPDDNEPKKKDKQVTEKEKKARERSKRRQKLKEKNECFKMELDQQISETSLIIEEARGDTIVNTCCMCEHSFDDVETFRIHAGLCLNVLMQKWFGQFKCKTCGTEYETAFSLLNHRLAQICKPGMLVREGDFYRCNYCNVKYPVRRKSELTLHILSHRNLKTQTCKHCGKSFTRWKSLQDHLVSHTGQKPYTCRHCPVTFRSSLGRRNHELTKHSDPKSYICEMCGSSFALKGRLDVHIRCVHTKTRYKCDICNKELKNKASMNLHKNAHANIKPHVCDICGRGFPRATVLNGHMRRHRNERIFFCDVCKKGFYMKQNLNVHMRTHNGIKPYCCSFCTYRCTIKGNLNKHVKACHSSDQVEADKAQTDVHLDSTIAC